jgi:hypothetical protein
MTLAHIVGVWGLILCTWGFGIISVMLFDMLRKH